MGATVFTFGVLLPVGVFRVAQCIKKKVLHLFEFSQRHNYRHKDRQPTSEDCRSLTSIS